MFAIELSINMIVFFSERRHYNTFLSIIGLSMKKRRISTKPCLNNRKVMYIYVQKDRVGQACSVWKSFCTLLTTGFWGKEAWRPITKWNTRFFFAFSKKNSAMATFGSNSKVRLENEKNKSLVLWKVEWTPCLFPT